MAYKPSDFAAGFGDVVSILLPGSVLAYMMLPPVARFATNVGMPPVADGTARWVAFSVAAYFLGHLAFLLGALLDYAYDPIREFIRPPGSDQLFEEAKKVRDRNAAAKAADLKVYRFAKAHLALRAPSAAADIARVEAESKFFRSVVAVLALLLLGYWEFLTSGPRFWGLVVLVLGFWRYAERRFKSNEQAFTLVIVDAGAQGSALKADTSA